MKSKKVSRRSLRVEPLEGRLCLASSVGWDGAGQGTAALTYYIGDVPDEVGLTQEQFETAIEAALDVWVDVAAVTFTQTTLPDQADSLDFEFATIDGVNGILAQSYLPDDLNPSIVAGDVQFDVADAWELGNSLGSAAFDLNYVAVHEIGHSLGLGHLTTAGSVMLSTVSPSQEFTGLSDADEAAILSLYASADGSTTNDTPTTNPTPPTTTPGSRPTTRPERPFAGPFTPSPFQGGRPGGSLTRPGQSNQGSLGRNMAGTLLNNPLSLNHNGSNTKAAVQSSVGAGSSVTSKSASLSHAQTSLTPSLKASLTSLSVRDAIFAQWKRS